MTVTTVGGPVQRRAVGAAARAERFVRVRPRAVRGRRRRIDRLGARARRCGCAHLGRGQHARRRIALADASADSDAEDVHSYVESELRKIVGPLAGKLHTGRSRNDQVATDLKLWLKKACDDFASLATSLARALAQRALDEAATPMPGYTHMKQAEPVTFGHWCMAYVDDAAARSLAHPRCARCAATNVRSAPAHWPARR